MPKTRKSHPPSPKAGCAGGHWQHKDGGPDRADVQSTDPSRRLEEQALAGLPDIFGNGREQMRRSRPIPRRMRASSKQTANQCRS